MVDFSTREALEFNWVAKLLKVEETSVVCVSIATKVSISSACASISRGTKDVDCCGTKPEAEHGRTTSENRLSTSDSSDMLWKGKLSSKNTQEMNTYLLAISYTRYPLMPGGYPIKIHKTVRSSNFDLWACKIEA